MNNKFQELNDAIGKKHDVIRQKRQAMEDAKKANDVTLSLTAQYQAQEMAVDENDPVVLRSIIVKQNMAIESCQNVIKKQDDYINEVNSLTLALATTAEVVGNELMSAKTKLKKEQNKSLLDRLFGF